MEREQAGHGVGGVSERVQLCVSCLLDEIAGRSTTSVGWEGKSNRTKKARGTDPVKLGRGSKARSEGETILPLLTLTSLHTPHTTHLHQLQVRSDIFNHPPSPPSQQAPSPSHLPFHLVPPTHSLLKTQHTFISHMSRARFSSAPIAPFILSTARQQYYCLPPQPPPVWLIPRLQSNTPASGACPEQYFPVPPSPPSS